MFISPLGVALNELQDYGGGLTLSRPDTLSDVVRRFQEGRPVDHY